jgi:phosphoglycerate dehydrogenase-like enzyme
MSRPGVIVLTDDAEAYLSLLSELARQGTELVAATTVQMARSVYTGQTVVLGQPDLAAAVLGDLPSVRWVQSSWAGVTPLLALNRKDFLLTGVKDTFGAQMAEYVLGYLLARELRLVERLEHQRQRDWWPAESGTLQGKILGIMGTGSIGRCIASKAAAFGLRVIGYSRSGAPVEGFEDVFRADRLAAFLAQPDYLVCVLPDTPETRHLLDEKAFGAMRRPCCVVNVGRGNVIDEAALAGALRSGEIAAAVLDVFQEEPLPVDSPLWDAPGLIVTAHMAAKSHPPAIARIFAENYNRFMAGEPLNYQIDFERGY